MPADGASYEDGVCFDPCELSNVALAVFADRLTICH